MNNPYTEDIIAKIERYLAKQMGEAERLAFEKEMDEDKDLQQLIEHHPMLIEALQMSSYKEDRENWKALQHEILKEETIMPDKEEKVTQPKLQKKLRLPILLLVIGILLGITMSAIYFIFNAPRQKNTKTEVNQERPIAGNESQEDDLLLGYTGDKVTRQIPFELVRREDSITGVVQNTTRPIFLIVEKEVFPSYLLQTDSLTLYLPETSMQTFVNARVAWRMEIDTDTLQYLKIADYWFPIHSSHKKQWLGNIEKEIFSNFNPK